VREINQKQFSSFQRDFGSSQVCGIGLGLVFWSLILWFTPFLLNNCISKLVLPRSVLCSWGDQDQNSWGGFCQGMGCVLEGFKIITFGVCVACNLGLIT